MALRIAEVVRGNIRIENVNITRKKSMSIAIIEPAPAVRTPKPLEYPDVTGILPSGMRIPAPEGVANDFSKILILEKEAMSDWSPSLPISIVIPVYNRADILSKTLAMITHQSYPLDLIEVVIADDGSQEDILAVANLFRDRLTITYVNQEDRGFRAAAARNMGIRSSSHEHIILLDADVAPVPTLVEVYARYFAVSSRSLFCGHRRYIDANMIEVSDIVDSPDPMLGLPDIVSQNEVFKKDGHVLDWRMGMYRQSDNLRFENIHLGQFAAEILDFTFRFSKGPEVSMRSSGHGGKRTQSGDSEFGTEVNTSYHSMRHVGFIKSQPVDETRQTGNLAYKK